MAGKPTLEEVAQQLEVVSSWLSGTRQAKVLALAASCRGQEAPEPTVQQQRDAERAAARAEAAAAAAEAQRAVAEAAKDAAKTPPG